MPDQDKTQNIQARQSQTPSAQQKTLPKIGILYFLLSDDRSIEEDLVAVVRKEISISTSKTLYLVIHSIGGDPYPAVRIMRMLRKRFSGKLFGVVPHRAMSAATLMLFGTDLIYMSEESQLGPLDLPMEHPIDGSSISALDVVDTLNQLQATSLEFAKTIYKDLRKGEFGERIGKDKAIEFALLHSRQLVLPTLEKVDPYHRQRALRKLRIGKWYAFDLLIKGMIPNGMRAMSAADKFVTTFPDHSYGIFKEDAVLCGIGIEDSDKLPIWNALCAVADPKIEAQENYIKYEEM
ncbi:MAG TPA: hypothetical protein VLH19_03540 [Patescibacteria group bacterium]|nr:hypothetical protein [Patescibacteria group bacterium]